MGFEVHDAEGGGEQAQRVDFVAGGDVGVKAGGALGHVLIGVQAGKGAAV